MSGLIAYTADGRITRADAPDCVVEYDRADAKRRGLPLPGEQAAAPEPDAATDLVIGQKVVRPKARKDG